MPTYEVVRGGSASALKVCLKRGEALKAESDAMVSKTDGVTLGATADGGVLGGFARSFLTGESFFLQTLQCDAAAGDVLIAPQEQGDIEVIELGLPGAAALEVLVTNGAFLCGDSTLNIDTKMQGISKAMFSGGGLFLMRCSGRGRLAVACLGSCIRYNLAQGERRQVDNGHLVAWDATVNYELGMAAKSLFGSAASGEGIMCTFTGPGSVWIQTHKQPPPSGKDGQRQTGGSSNVAGMFFMCIFLLIFLSVFGFIAYMAIMHPDQVEWGNGGGGGSQSRPRGRRSKVGRLEY